MNSRNLAVSVARGRVAFGVAALLAPGVFGRAIGGAAAAQGLAPMFLRMFGVRDLALGLGTILAVKHETPVRGWVEAGMLADAGDLAAAVLARQQLSPLAFKGTVAIAGGAAVSGAALARLVDAV